MRSSNMHEKKVVNRITALLLSLLMIFVFTAPYANASNVEIDEDGGIWDYDAGTYTSPEGEVFPIEMSSEPKPEDKSDNDKEPIVYQDGRVYITEGNSPITIEDEINIVSEEASLSPAVSVTSGQLDFDENGNIVVGKTEAHFLEDINVEMNVPAGNEEALVVSGTGLEVGSSNGGEAIAEVDGSVRIEVSKADEDIQSVANAARVSVNGDGKAELNVKGNLEAQSDGFSTGINITTDFAHDEKESSAIVSVEGDIIAAGDRGARGIDASDIQYTDGVNEKAEWKMDVGGDIIANGGSQEGTGVSAYIHNGDVDIIVDGEIAATSKADSTGVEVFTSGKDSEVSVAVDGSIIAEGAKAEGIAVTQSGQENETSVIVNDDISVSSTGEGSDTDGIIIYQYGESIANVNVNGNISALSSGGKTSAEGIYINQRDGAVSNVNVEGDISAEAKGEYSGAKALYVVSDSSESNISIDGNLTAKAVELEEGETHAIVASAKNGAEINLDVQGKVYSQSPNNSWTVDASANNATINIVIQDGAELHSDNGSALLLQTEGADSKISATSNDELKAIRNGTDWSDSVEGVALFNHGGSIEVNVNGDITGTDGIYLAGGENVEKIPVEDDAPLDFQNYEMYRTHYREGDDPDAVTPDYFSAELGYFYTEAGERWQEVDKTTEGENAIFVDGDVNAEKTGIVVGNWSENVSNDVVITGTLSGSERAVEYMNGTQIDNFTLTVWKVEQNESGNVVERYLGRDENNEDVYEADREAEKKIQYIIKIDDSSVNSITGLDGTVEYKGFDTAHEGDTVTLKITVPEGYMISGAYTGNGSERIQLQQDEKGNYYVVVPKGGGVLLSALLEEIVSGKAEPEVKVEVESRKSQFRGTSDTDQTKSIKDRIKESAKNANLLNVLPETIRKNIPESYDKLADLLTLRLTDYWQYMGNVNLFLKTSVAFEEGEEAYVVLIVPESENNQYYVLQGKGLRNGGLLVTLDRETAKEIVNKTFIAMVLAH